MATARNNMENPIELSGTDQFDLAQVKKMTTLTCLAECKTPIFKWRIKKLEYEKEQESENFVFNHDQNFGKLSLMFYRNLNWEITATFYDFGKTEDESEMSSGSSSYLVFKCKGDCDSYSWNKEEFCEQIIVFSGRGQSKHLISGSSKYNNRYVGFFNIKVYQVPAGAIPHLFTTPKSNNNNIMIVGKIENFSKARKADDTKGLNKQPCFIFGSAEQRMTVMFLPTQEYSEDGFGLMALLKIVDERDNLVPVIPDFVTFTIFSERKEIDMIQKCVINRAEKIFVYKKFLADFTELDKMIVNDILYYKIVLEPMRRNSFR